MYNISLLGIITLGIYCVVIILYPYVYTQRLHKTSPPTGVSGHIIQGTGTGKGTLKVVVIGDSTAIGQGTNSVFDSFSYQYVQGLSSQYEKINYTNIAVSGSKTENVIADQIPLLKESYDLIIISIGANDITQRVSQKDYQDNIKKIVQQLEKKSSHIIWMMVPDFITVPVLLPPLNTYFSSKSFEFNQTTARIIQAKNTITFVDTYNGTRQPFKDQPNIYFSKDHYHPSKEGYKLWAEQISKSLERI